MEKHQMSAKAIFEEAFEIAASAERIAYLDQVCSNSPELRKKVDGLLRAYGNNEFMSLCCEEVQTHKGASQAEERILDFGKPIETASQAAEGM